MRSQIRNTLRFWLLAASDTLPHFCRFIWKWLIPEIGVLLAGAIFLSVQVIHDGGGLGAMLANLVSWAVPAISGIAIYALFVFLFHLIAAPARIYAEQEKRIEEIAAQLAEKSKQAELREALSSLYALRASGAELRDMPDLRRIQQWVARVSGVLEESCDQLYKEKFLLSPDPPANSVNWEARDLTQVMLELSMTGKLAALTEIILDLEKRRE